MEEMTEGQAPPEVGDLCEVAGAKKLHTNKMGAAQHDYMLGCSSCASWLRDKGN